MDENTQQAETLEQQAPELIQEAPVPSVEQTTAKADELPESASDRTRHEFEKLRADLREERTRRELLESRFSATQTKVATPEPIYDPNTGYVNEAVLTETQRRAIEAEERARKAEEAITQFRTEQETKEAYQVHPEANPEAKEFDPKLKQLASSIILRSMVAPEEFGNKQLNLREAYDFLKTNVIVNNSAVEAARKEGAQEAIEQLTPKEQAALEAIGTPARRSDVGQTHETLVQRTRKGDFSAIAERMNRIVGKQE